MNTRARRERGEKGQTKTCSWLQRRARKNTFTLDVRTLSYSQMIPFQPRDSLPQVSAAKGLHRSTARSPCANSPPSAALKKSTMELQKARQRSLNSPPCYLLLRFLAAPLHCRGGKCKLQTLFKSGVNAHNVSHWCARCADNWSAVSPSTCNSLRRHGSKWQ
jgi:hypothetical protein